MAARAFSSFLFLSLAIVKRVAEFRASNAGGRRVAAGRGYLASDMQLMQLMGVASSFVSALVLALYVQSQMPSGAAQRPTVARIIVPLVLFWECRIWLSTARGQMNEDPIVFAARDWVVAGCSRLFRYLAARSGDHQFSLPGLL